MFFEAIVCSIPLVQTNAQIFSGTFCIVYHLFEYGISIIHSFVKLLLTDWHGIDEIVSQNSSMSFHIRRLLYYVCKIIIKCAIDDKK